MKVRVFTDGACSNNGKAGARASYACWFPEHKELSKAEIVPVDNLQTNNVAELMAIQQALKIIEEKLPYQEVELQIYTDSIYSKKALTEWIIGWQVNNFKNNTIKNRELIEDTVKRLPKFKNYCISYVAAHTGKNDELSKHNDVVDRMAVAVLNPEVAEFKIIHTNTQKAIEGFPVELMGPHVTEGIIVEWCRNNLDKLDHDVLNAALLQVVTKTLKQKGFNLDRHRLHRSSVYGLTANNLIVEGTKIVKEE
jgi:ribonuclease HI